MSDVKTFMERVEALMDEYCQETGKSREELALEMVQAIGLKMSADITAAQTREAADPVAETSVS